MSDSESDDNVNSFVGDAWVMYRDRPDWKDVTPIKEEDTVKPAVAIEYSERYSDVMDYFRAIMVSNERSERAFTLCTDAAALNPSNFIVWSYRRRLLKHLNKNLFAELLYLSNVIKKHPKTYQVWHHRKIVVEWLDDGFDELAFTAKILERDGKNYHAWQHRQWVIETFKLPEYELHYVEELLVKDVWNNSAWNHRYFTIQSTTGFTSEVVVREMEYALNKLQLSVSNESAWNYLRGILSNCSFGLNEPQCLRFAEETFNSGKRSRQLMLYLYDAAIELLNTNFSVVSPTSVSLLQRALKMLELLSSKYDKSRVKYWDNLHAQLERSHAYLFKVLPVAMEICENDVRPTTG